MSWPYRLLLLLAPFSSFAQNGKGISFKKDAWNEILKQAKVEKKIIFVDAYASWCGPCKMMSANVFTNEEVGGFFNRNFINAKIDMEVGEGIDLASRYEVTAYPTLLFINSEGKLLHKAIGYQEAADFMTTGRNALDPGKQFYTLKEAFSKGRLSDEQLYTLATMAIDLEDPAANNLASSYLNNKKNCLTATCIDLMLRITRDPADPYFSFLSKNEKEAGAVVGKEKVSGGLDQIVFDAISKGISEKETTPSAVNKVENGMKKYRPEPAARRFALVYGIYIANEKSEGELYKKYLVKYLDEFGEEQSWSELNQYAWDFFEKENDKDLLKSALGWALKSISKESNYYNNDTAAHLYHKLGNKEEARKYAVKAIQLGKSIGEDISATEELLKKLN